MTINRSPLKDSDFFIYAKFLLATTGTVQSNISNAVVFPLRQTLLKCLPLQIVERLEEMGQRRLKSRQYNGTNLQGLVTTGWKAGYQKWTVPASGDYWIEALGARGLTQIILEVEWAFVRGKFSLTAGDELNIVVGQTGEITLIGMMEQVAGRFLRFADTNNT